MRGLTRLERQLLIDRAIGASRLRANLGEPVDTARRILVKSGRLVFTIENSPTGKVRRTRITDLGRLALRVCPPEES